MPYRLEAGEALADGLRRSLLEELDRAATLLGDADPNDVDEDVHEARKALKRARTAVRLLRPVLGEERFRSASARLRDAGRALAGTRDAAVLVDCLDTLTAPASASDEASPPDGAGQPFAGLRARLVQEHEEARRLALETAGPRADALERIMAGRADSARWDLGSGLDGRVVAGVQRVYRSGRRRLRAARDEPTAEALHGWRKRVKDLGYTTELFAPSSPQALEPLSGELRRLWELLGEHHDLHLLGGVAGQRPSAFVSAVERADLDRRLARRRTELAEQALALGDRLYAEAPGAFGKRVAAYVRAWQGA